MCDCRCSTSRPATSPTAADSASSSASRAGDQRLGVVVAASWPWTRASASQCARLVLEIVHSPQHTRHATMEGMRSVVLALAALLVVVAVAFAQDPAPPPEPPPRPPTADRRRRTPIPTPRRDGRPGVPPDFAAVTWHDSKALGKPGAQGPAAGRRPAPRARRGLLHLGPDLQPDPQPRVAPLGHRPPDPHRAHRAARVPHRARQRPARRDHGPLAHRTAASSAATTAASGTRRTRTGSTPTSSIRARTGPRRARPSPHRSIASSRRTSSTASSRPAR